MTDQVTKTDRVDASKSVDEAIACIAGRLVAQYDVSYIKSGDFSRVGGDGEWVVSVSAVIKEDSDD